MTSATLTSNDARIVSLYNHATSLVAKRPTAYLTNNAFNLTLSSELLDYANAAGGHSGYKSGARPVGIRVTSINPEATRNDVLSSIDEFTAFINSSECDGVEYFSNKLDTYLSKKSQKIDIRPTKEAFYAEGNTFADLQTLRAKFGKETVDTAFTVLFWTEFQLRFGL